MDARIRFTKYAIKKEFIQLLKETNISKITVSSICSNANINRATFYKYYDNPYDLLVKIETELLDNLQGKIEALPNRDPIEMTRTVLNDIKENSDVYMVIFSRNGDLAFKERIFSVCYQENMKYINLCFPTLTNMQKEWLYDYVLEGTNGIINQWLNNGMTTPIDDVVAFTQIIAKTLHENLLKYVD